MSLRALSISFGILIIFTLVACGGEEEEIPVTENVPTNNEWTDSIFGKINGEQQLYQHLIIEIPDYYQQRTDSLVGWIEEKQPGALKFENWNPDSIQFVKQTLDTLDIIQPFIYCDYFEFLNIPRYPYWKANRKNQDPSLTRIFQKSRMNILDFGYSLDMDPSTRTWLDTIQKMQSIYAVTSRYSDEHVQEDFNDFMLSMQRYDHNILVEIGTYDTVVFENFRKSTGYQGLFIADTKNGSISTLLNGGLDLAFKHIESPNIYGEITKTTVQYDASTKRILNLKSKVDNDIKEQHLQPEIDYTSLNLIHNSAAIISDKSKMLPFTARYSIYAGENLRVDQKVRKDVQVRVQKSDLTKKSLQNICKANGKKVVVLHDSVSNDALDYLNGLNKKNDALICFSDPEQFEKIKKTPNLMFLPSWHKQSANILVQQLSSRLRLDGAYVDKDSVLDKKILKKTLIARTVPEYMGIDQDTLNRINWAINNAMNGRAFPGCAVLLAKKGSIIYDRQFGHHSYDRQKVVTDESLYDLASITKVMSTTLMGMKLWEMGKYDLKDSLYMYLPDSLKFHLRYPSTIRNITFHELLIHKSGLPAGFPLIRYLDYKTEEIGVFDKYYCDVSDTSYCIEVAQDFYLEKEYKDSMWLKLNQMWLDKSKPYKYSDVNMNTMYFMLKGMIDNDPRSFGFTDRADDLKDRNLYEEYLYKTFYKPLGMERSRFLPLRFFAQNQIVPTENETFWRKQLLHGHVHDPNAALMGGVAGNAGMFSTTNDMVKLCQMWLDKGVYGGKRYLNAETVEKFTTQAENSHRGLGFNKRTISTTGFGMADSSSISTYGHTGFTGTCFWIDPESDMIYIFLSNRVHPKVNNRIYQFGIRKRVHNALYDARLNY